MLSADLCNKEVKDYLSTFGRRVLDLKIISFFKISFFLTEFNPKILSLYYPSLTQVVILALLFGYEMHKNIYTDILSGPLKQIKLEVKNRGEVVAPWNYAKESGLHYSTL